MAKTLNDMLDELKDSINGREGDMLFYMLQEFVDKKFGQELKAELKKAPISIGWDPMSSRGNVLLVHKITRLTLSKKDIKEFMSTKYKEWQEINE